MTSNVPLYPFLRVRRDGIDDILTFAMSRGHRHSAPPVSSITGNGNPRARRAGRPGARGVFVSLPLGRPLGQRGCRPFRTQRAVGLRLGFMLITIHAPSHASGCRYGDKNGCGKR